MYHHEGFYLSNNDDPVSQATTSHFFDNIYDHLDIKLWSQATRNVWTVSVNLNLCKNLLAADRLTCAKSDQKT
jgi:hypothetical protein